LASFTYERANGDQFVGVNEQATILADEVRFNAYGRAIAKHVRTSFLS